MERRLLALEKAPGDQETLHGLFRAAHTLKGGALDTSTGGNAGMIIPYTLAQPDIKEKIQALAFESIADTPAKTGEYVRSEVQRWGQVVRRINIKPE